MERDRRLTDAPRGAPTCRPTTSTPTLWVPPDVVIGIDVTRYGLPSAVTSPRTPCRVRAPFTRGRSGPRWLAIPAGSKEGANVRASRYDRYRRRPSGSSTATSPGLPLPRCSAPVPRGPSGVACSPSTQSTASELASARASMLSSASSASRLSAACSAFWPTAWLSRRTTFSSHTKRVTAQRTRTVPGADDARDDDCTVSHGAPMAPRASSDKGPPPGRAPVRDGATGARGEASVRLPTDTLGSQGLTLHARGDHGCKACVKNRNAQLNGRPRAVDTEVRAAA